MIGKKFMTAMAVLALMLAGFGAVFIADANDADPAPDVEYEVGAVINVTDGVITYTAEEILAADDIETILGDTEGAMYYFQLKEDAFDDLTLIKMTYYDAIKGYIVPSYPLAPAPATDFGAIAIAVADYSGMTNAEKTTFNQAVTAFCDAGICTIIEVATPAVIIAEEEDALADAVADVTAEKDAVIAEKDAVIAEKTATITAKDGVIAEKDTVIAEKDAEIAELQATIDADTSATALAEKDKTIAEKDKAIADKDAQIKELTDKVASLDVKEKPLWETGIGQCLIIIVAFLALMVVWFLYKNGTFAKVFKKKVKAEEKKE